MCTALKFNAEQFSEAFGWMTASPASRSPGIDIHYGRSHVTVRRMGYPERLAEAANKRSCDSHSGKKCVVGLMLLWPNHYEDERKWV